MSSRRAILGARTRFPSPLRYPGGKGKIANFMKLLVLRNDLLGAHYVEPYAGGAGVALSLLFEEYVSSIHINDIDMGVFQFWTAVIESTDQLCRRIADAPVDMDQWRRQQDVQLAEDPDPVDLAFSTFFLNRTNRAGIVRGGVIGGKCQRGKWKLDARYNRNELIYRIRKIARYRSRITVSCLDAANLLSDAEVAIQTSVLFYLDPPYFKKGSGLYLNFYEPGDHQRLAELVAELRRPWVVSYDATPEVEALYLGFQQIHYGLSYSAGDRYRGGEVMFFSPGVSPPSVDSPANIRSKEVDKERIRALSG